MSAKIVFSGLCLSSSFPFFLPDQAVDFAKSKGVGYIRTSAKTGMAREDRGEMNLF